MGKKLKAVEPSPEVLEQAQTILERGGNPSDVAPEHWLWLAEDAAERGVLETLVALETRVTAKAFQKGLRRIQHKLRSRGVVLERRQQVVSLAPSQQVTYEGALTLASLEGEMVGCIARHVHGEPSMFTVFRVVSTGDDLVEPDWVSPNEARDTKRNLMDELSELHEMDASTGPYLEWVLQTLLAHHRTEGFRAELTEMETALGPKPEGPHPVEVTLEQRGIAIPMSVATSGDLLDDPYYAMLRPTHEAVARCVERFERVEQSPIMLADYQVMDRLRQEADEVLDAVVDESGRAQVVRGLMHTAWMATHHGRWSEAATLVRVARMLEEGQAPHTIPLFLAMFQPLLIQFHAQMMAPDASGPEMGEAAPLSTGLMGSEPSIGRGGLWLPSGMKGDG